MINNILLTPVLFFLSIAVLWYIYFWLYKDYVVERFRQNLFELRDNLFDDAHAGLIDFNHPAYCILRGTMNGCIRYAHDMKLLHLLLGSFLCRKSSLRTEAKYYFQNQFQHAINDIDEEAVKKLKEYRKKMNNFIVFHVLREAPLICIFCLICMTSLVIPVIILVLFYDQIKRRIKSFLSTEINSMESVAFEIGKI